MPKTFYDQIERFERFDFAAFFSRVKPEDVERVLAKDSLSETDFLVLLSEEAFGCLEPLAQKAKRITVGNFGKVIQLYAPLYLSNYCENDCAYCGFKHSNPIARKRLSLTELRQEAEEIAKSGIRQILLLTGESRAQSPLSYIKECVSLLKQTFSMISIEIYPLSVDEYAQLIAAGVCGLTIYQETYDQRLYAQLHGQGPKSDYRFRLEAPQRAAQAGMRQINIGALLGLAEFRKEVFLAGLHAYWLERYYPDIELGISFPRIQPQVGSFSPAYPLRDRDLTQAIVATRIFLPRAGITISTRETKELRDNLIGLGLTRLSAGSRTQVGGYALSDKTEGQFEIADTSSVETIRQMVCRKGYQPVFSDWQNGMNRA
ncbi:MAG: 2-iminoacetate synthase ThiH [Candidatus Omnitrophota bacterium]|nr:2-iminoacetate synthase ThiH [Candidatus Omnitrophota bacterium]